jgi:hypothetical protein
MSRLTYTDGMASDDRTLTHPTAPVHAAHYCEHPGCNEWGGLGFVRMKGEQGNWWCAHHYPHWREDIRAKFEALPVG